MYMSSKATQIWRNLCKGTHCHLSGVLADFQSQNRGVLLSLKDYTAFHVRDAFVQVDSGCYVA
jgi:hypothetical protein